MGYAAETRSKKVAAAEAPVPAADSTPAPLDAHASHRHDVVMRLKRVEGQIRGVLSMIDADAPCDAVAQQLAAARKALDRAFYEMMVCDIEREIGSTQDIAVLGRRLVEKTRLLAKYS